MRDSYSFLGKFAQWNFNGATCKNKKQGKPRTVPITEIASLFLPDSEGSGLIFHAHSNQKTNEYLKTLARRAKVSKPVSFKFARATFASIFSEEKGNPKTLQEILGHSAITTTMRYYIDVSEEQKRKEASAFEKFKPKKTIGKG